MSTIFFESWEVLRSAEAFNTLFDLWYCIWVPSVKLTGALSTFDAQAECVVFLVQGWLALLIQFVSAWLRFNMALSQTRDVETPSRWGQLVKVSRSWSFSLVVFCSGAWRRWFDKDVHLTRTKTSETYRASFDILWTHFRHIDSGLWILVMTLRILRLHDLLLCYFRLPVF